MASKKPKAKAEWRRKGSGFVTMRVPNHILAAVDKVAHQEDRSRTKQFLRYVRQGLLADNVNILYPTEEKEE